MPAPADDRVYYVISDLHIGGDEQLEPIEFREELLSFLKELETTDENAELIINGDAFGLWEITTASGVDKFDLLTKNYPELFTQFEKTGENIPITLLPGNHDHELAAYPAYEDRLSAYNITLVSELSVTRPIGERTIYFEHGHQQDPNNTISDFGNPHARPLGYYYNTLVTSRAGQLSDRGRFNWLKDVQAVTPTERLPVWLLSKYFYREMNPFLRYAAVPFLLLFNISAVLAVLAGLDIIGIWSFPVETTVAFLRRFGRAGTVAYFVLAVNISVAGLLLLVGIPLFFLQRDLKQTIDRFGIFETSLTVDTAQPYLSAANDVFTSAPETAIYCYGHTHRPRVRRLENRLLVNTGTWLKRLHRRDGITGILPPVFYPSYQLFVVRITADEDEIAVEFNEIDKPSPVQEDLTLTERILTIGREPALDVSSRTVIPNDPPEQTD